MLASFLVFPQKIPYPHLPPIPPPTHSHPWSWHSPILGYRAMERVTETKFRAETEGTTIQRLPHLGIHPINNHQTQTLWQMSTRAWWQEPDIAVSCEAMPMPGKYRSGCSQSSIGQSTRSPMKEPEKYPGSWRGLKPHRRNINMN